MSLVGFLEYVEKNGKLPDDIEPRAFAYLSYVENASGRYALTPEGKKCLADLKNLASALADGLVTGDRLLDDGLEH